MSFNLSTLTSNNYKNNLRFIILLVFVTSCGSSIAAQSINEEKTALSNFIKRMYNATPFEGVKIMDDYSSQYLVSLLSLDKALYPTNTTKTRIAQVKAQSQASSNINGTSVSTDLIIKTIY